ncbi:MAG: DoxX family protein [Gammaproteobacteria bacterium]
MIIQIIGRLRQLLNQGLDFLAPLGQFSARVWIAYIFFTAGLVKIQSWVTTETLFTYEYQVPLLPPVMAAVLATGAELLLPVLVVLGLGGRFIYVVLFVYNAIAVASYPYLWTTAGLPGLLQHLNWGLLIMMLMFFGSGKISLDYWLQQRFSPKASLVKNPSRPHKFHKLGVNP